MTSDIESHSQLTPLSYPHPAAQTRQQQQQRRSGHPKFKPIASVTAMEAFGFQNPCILPPESIYHHSCGSAASSCCSQPALTTSDFPAKSKPHHQTPPYPHISSTKRSYKVPPQRETDELHGINVPEQKVAFPLMAQEQYDFRCQNRC